MRIVQSFPHLCAVVMFIAAFTLVHCATARAEGRQNFRHAEGRSLQSGIASWYGNEHNGRKAANREIHDSRLATAAHLRLPFSSVVRVTNRKTGASVVVPINDRGPYVKGRVIDLSEQAARRQAVRVNGPL